MSKYSRLAETDIQEKVISLIEKELNKRGIRIVGATRIGKYPQTVILDLTHQGSEISVSSNGSFKIENSNLSNEELDKIGEAIDYGIEDEVY